MKSVHSSETPDYDYSMIRCHTVSYTAALASTKYGRNIVFRHLNKVILQGHIVSKFSGLFHNTWLRPQLLARLLGCSYHRDVLTAGPN
jgi:hypothetical protein